MDRPTWVIMPAGLSDRRRVAAYACLGGYLAVTMIDVTAEALRSGRWSFAVLALAMPILVGLVLITMVRSRVRLLLLISLGFAWLGDTIGVDVLVKIIFFLGAQIAYCVCFWPLRQLSLLARRSSLIIFSVIMVLVIAAMAIAAGPLAVPVIVYGALLGLMVGLASGVSRLTMIGAGIFLASDILLGYQYFLVGEQSTVNATAIGAYLTGQLLIVLGLIRHSAALPRVKA